MAEEVNSTTADKLKSAKLKILGLLPKILPFIALAAAGISFIFTFLIGVNSSVTGRQVFFYDYFKSENINAYKLLDGAYAGAMRTTSLAGLLLGVFGLIAVIACAAFTCYKAVRAYAFKKDENVEKAAFCTYFLYIVFAGLNLAINNAATDTVGVGYNGATIAGIVLSTVAACTYVGLRIYLNRQWFKDKYRLSDFIYKAVRIVVLAITVGLVTAPILTITGSEGVSGFKTNFIQLITMSLFTTQGNRLNSVVSSSAGGTVAVVAICAYFTALIATNLFSLFGNRKNDKVFYIIGVVIALVLLFFSAVASSFYNDIAEGTGFWLSIPIAVVSLSVALAAAAVIYPIVIENIAKRADKKKSQNGGETFLEVKDLSQYFVVGRDFFGRPTKYLKAVDKVSFKLEKGQTLGIVGESGCGKTTMGRTILRLYDVTGGEVWFKGQKISSLSNRDFDKLRPDMQMIFQDPYASLSPRLTVGEIIGEAVKQHKLVPKSEYHEYVLSVMKMCGLQPHYFERYPHEFSGGQRQRICIARALALKPELVICDEPVSALDVSIQAQIINMLIELRKTLGLTYVFISHDLSVVKHISDMVGVMYLGSMVEYGSRDNIFENTLHPYTKALFSAVPVPDPHVKMNRIILKGDIPSPVNPPSGCKFHTRCESCMEICGRISPKFKEVEAGHFCACHLYDSEDEVKEMKEKYAEQQRLAELEKAEHKKNVWEIVKEKVKSVVKKSDKAADGETEADDAAEE